MKVIRLLTLVLSAFALPALTLFPSPSMGQGSVVSPDKIPALAIPRMSKPPAIDGTIDPVEWRESVAISGVNDCYNDLLLARPTTYYIAWDADNIYLAMRTWVRPNSKPAVNGRSPGTASCFDSGAELHFQPMGRNVRVGQTESSYKFIINCLGYDGDYQRVSVGQQFRNWLPTFKSKTRLTEPGSAPLGGRWWECETVMPAREFELVGPNQVGDQWRMMLGFNHMYSGWTQARIPAYSSYHDPVGYPVGTLVENTPAVQMTMDGLPGPLDGVATAKIKAYNPTNKPVELSVLARYADENDQDMIKKEELLTVAPGQEAVFEIDERLPKKLPNKPGSIRLQVKQENNELLRYYVKFNNAPYPEDVLVSPKAEPGRFPLQATFNPVKSTILLSADRYYQDNPEDMECVRYRITRNGDSKPVAEGTISECITDYYTRQIKMSSLKDGEYTILAEMYRKDGSKVGSEKATFKKLDEAEAFPEWWNTKLGDPERVIKPFTAMTRKDNVVSMWGRSYTLSPLGLPVAVKSQGKAVSSSPARIVVKLGGKEHIVPLKGVPTFTGTKDWRVSFKGTAEGAGLTFKASGMVEQDGLALVNLTYSPTGGKPVKVDALRIEFPMRDDVAECLVCLGPGANYSARTTTVLPADKQGKLWDVFDTGKSGALMTVGSFYPCVWLGNEERGMLWWADNDKGWVPDDDIPAHEVFRDGKEVVLRNNIIGKPFSIDAPRTITFTYMASPFRPLEKGWRACSNSENGTFMGPAKTRGNPGEADYVNGWAWITPPSKDPERWSELWAEHKVIADKRVRDLQPFNPLQAHRNNYVHTSLPLIGYGWKSPDERVTSYFASDWWNDTWSKTEQDYFLYLADRAFREGGLRAIYWDVFFLAQFKNLQTGLAYELPDGRVQPGYNGLNIRQFMMRLHALMNDRGLTPFANTVHASNDYVLVACGWVESILDGEHHLIYDTSGVDWVDGYPIERMRSLSVSGTWGVQISWMHLIKFKDNEKFARAFRGHTDYQRLFDTWTSWHAGPMPEPVLDFGLNEEAVKYIPFWRNPYVQINDKDILVSMWQLPDRVVLQVFNYNRSETKDAVLKIDLDKLNLVPKLKWQEFIGVRDLVKGEKEPKSTLDFYGRTLNVPKIEPHTGRTIGIRLY